MIAKIIEYTLVVFFFFFESIRLSPEGSLRL